MVTLTFRTFMKVDFGGFCWIFWSIFVGSEFQVKNHCGFPSLSRQPLVKADIAKGLLPIGKDKGTKQ